LHCARARARVSVRLKQMHQAAATSQQPTDREGAMSNRRVELPGFPSLVAVRPINAPVEANTCLSPHPTRACRVLFCEIFASFEPTTTADHWLGQINNLEALQDFPISLWRQWPVHILFPVHPRAALEWVAPVHFCKPCTSTGHCFLFYLFVFSGEQRTAAISSRI
jgi:hypothetical protein